MTFLVSSCEDRFGFGFGFSSWFFRLLFRGKISSSRHEIDFALASSLGGGGGDDRLCFIPPFRFGFSIPPVSVLAAKFLPRRRPTRLQQRAMREVVGENVQISVVEAAKETREPMYL